MSSTEAEQYGYDQEYWDQLPDEAKDDIRAEAARVLAEPVEDPHG